VEAFASCPYPHCLWEWKKGKQRCWRISSPGHTRAWKSGILLEKVVERESLVYGLHHNPGFETELAEERRRGPSATDSSRSSWNFNIPLRPPLTHNKR